MVDGAIPLHGYLTGMINKRSKIDEMEVPLIMVNAITYSSLMISQNPGPRSILS